MKAIFACRALFLLSLTAAAVSTLGANDPWPEVTQTTTQSSWTSAAGGVFSTASNWSGGVPTITDSSIVNGYLYNSGSGGYTVSVDSPATVNYLYIGPDYQKSASGTVTLLVTNDLEFSSPNAMWNVYRPGSGDYKDVYRQSLLMSGAKTEIVVSNGATLAFSPVYASGTMWCNESLAKLTDGARLFVTNATLTLQKLRNSSNGNQHLKFELQGTASATSTLQVVDGVVNYSADADSASYSGPLKFKEYSRGVFTDSTLHMGYEMDLRSSSVSKPNCEILINGSSRYLWEMSNYGSFMNGGHVVFDGDACLTNAATVDAAGNIFVAPTVAGSLCHLEFKGRSSAILDGVYKCNEFRLGGGGVNATTRLTFDSEGELRTWSGITVGRHYGVGELMLKRGFLQIPGTAKLSVGLTDNNSSYLGQAVTGRVEMTGGKLLLKAGSSEKMTGIQIGCGADLRSSTATDCYSCGEFNFSDGIISNNASLWIGTGYARGSYRQTGGSYVAQGGHIIVGAGGGEGELVVAGGSFDIPYNKSGAVGYVLIGGLSSYYESSIGIIRSKMPTYFPYSRTSGSGRLCVSNATFTVGNYGTRGIVLGSAGTGTLELHEDADVSAYYVAATNGAASNLKFVLGETATPLLTASYELAVSAGARLTVDARRYKGKSKWIQLVKFCNASSHWGSSRGVANGDYFDADCIETLGPATVVQVHDPDEAGGRDSGLWLHVRSGILITFR